MNSKLDRRVKKYENVTATSVTPVTVTESLQGKMGKIKRSLFPLPVTEDR
jgi:hypothetical protein